MAAQLVLVRVLGQIPARHPQTCVGARVPRIHYPRQRLDEMPQDRSLTCPWLAQYDHRAVSRDYRGKRECSVTQPSAFDDHVVIPSAKRLGDARNRILRYGVRATDSADPRHVKTEHISHNGPILSVLADSKRGDRLPQIRPLHLARGLSPHTVRRTPDQDRRTPSPAITKRPVQRPMAIIAAGHRPTPLLGDEEGLTFRDPAPAVPAGENGPTRTPRVGPFWAVGPWAGQTAEAAGAAGEGGPVRGAVWWAAARYLAASVATTCSQQRGTRRRPHQEASPRAAAGRRLAAEPDDGPHMVRAVDSAERSQHAPGRPRVVSAPRGTVATPRRASTAARLQPPRGGAAVA